MEDRNPVQPRPKAWTDATVAEAALRVPATVTDQIAYLRQHAQLLAALGVSVNARYRDLSTAVGVLVESSQYPEGGDFAAAVGRRLELDVVGDVLWGLVGRFRLDDDRDDSPEVATMIAESGAFQRHRGSVRDFVDRLAELDDEQVLEQQEVQRLSSLVSQYRSALRAVATLAATDWQRIALGDEDDRPFDAAIA